MQNILTKVNIKMSSNIITMTGDIGSGKSSVANEMASMTSYNIVSTGEIQRSIAESRGMTTLELLSSGDKSVDDEIDSQVAEIGKSNEKVILDSRLAWNFAPDSFKVYLSVDPEVGAERVFSDERSSENNTTIEGTLKSNLARMSKEDEVFKSLYDVNIRNMANYDAVIDTSDKLPTEIALEVFTEFREWKKEISLTQNVSTNAELSM